MVSAVSVVSVRSALLSHASVDDAVVVPRPVGEAIEQVAYVVRSAPVAPHDLLAHVAAHGLPAPDAIVFIGCMPYRADGDADVEALLHHGIPDDVILREVEQRLTSSPGVTAAAVVVRDVPLVPLPWHVEAIARASVVPTNPQSALAAAPSTAVAAVGVGLAADPAIADGGPALDPGPDAPRVLGEVLARAASSRRADAGLTYLLHDGTERFERYAELLERAERCLGGLQARGVEPGSRVLLLLPRHSDFLAAFWACALGGIVPVPLAVPQRFDGPNALAGVDGAARVTTPAALVTSLATEPFRQSTALTCPILDVESLLAGPSGRAHAAQPADLALLMMTSGSTGDPKAVMLSHANLLARTVASRFVNSLTEDDVSLNWMPLDHVAGLVYFHIRDVYLRTHQVHVPTSMVIESPLAWLDALQRFRVTVTFAPNFAYGLVLDRSEVLATRRWDLSTVRLVLNGAEAIVARTARRFLSALAPHGLRPTAMVPAWGMSETTSGVTYHHEFSLQTTSDDQPFVEVGRPIPGCTMRIVDTDDRLLCEGETGQLQVRGAIVTAGYFGAPGLTADAFTSDGWFRTGDLGVVRGGVLTVTGRTKDVVIVNSVNYYCHAIESAAESVDGVVPSFAAACAIRRRGADTDSLAVFFVPRYDDPTTLAELVRRVRSAVAVQVGLNPEVVVPLPASEIPKTSLGKIQRAALSQRFMAGELDEHRRYADRLLSATNTVPAWFFRPVWIAKRAVGEGVSLTGEPVLLIGDAGALTEHVTRALTAAGAAVHTVRPMVSAIDAYERVLDALDARGVRVRHVVHAVEHQTQEDVEPIDALEHALAHGPLDVLALVRALERNHRPGEFVRLTVVANRVHQVLPTDPVTPRRAITTGIVKSLAQEADWLFARHVDIAGDDPVDVARIAVLEHADHATDREVAYRDGRRFVPRLEALDPSVGSAGDATITRGGRYLVTGGAGGVGTALAEWLVERFAARLLLVGRRAADEGAAAFVERLTTRGADVTYESVDICDQARVEAAVARHEARWEAPLSGVFHLAGTYHRAPVVRETPSSFLEVLRPKVVGTSVLHRLLEARGGGLFVGWSSVAGVFGGADASAYASACAFQRSYAVANGAGRVRHYCVDWSSWLDTGQSTGLPLEVTRSRGHLSMAPRAALDSLLAVLATGHTSVAIGLDGTNRHVRRVLASEDRPVPWLVGFYSGAAAPSAVQAATRGVSDRFGRPVEVSTACIPALPLTGAGEIDAVRLATWETGRSNGSGGSAPHTVAERRLEALWRRVLSAPAVTVADNFFESGGDSLSAVRLAGLVRDELGVDVGVRAIFEASTFAALARVVDEASPVVGRATEHVERDALDPIVTCDGASNPTRPSAGQRALWFLHQLAPHGSALNIAFTARVHSALDTEALRRAFQALVDHHASLRAVFPAEEGVPVRRVLGHMTVPFVHTDVSGWAEADILGAVSTEIGRPFDLRTGPLLRVHLFTAAHGPAVLALSVHHVVLDGWSLWMCLEELAAHYAVLTRGGALDVRTEDEFSRYVRSESELVAGQAGEEHAHYWRERLIDAPTLSLPTDHRRPATPRFEGRSVHVRWGRDLANRIRAAAQDARCTPHMIVLALFRALLVRYSGQSDITIGYMASGRSSGAVDEVVGYLANPVALRAVAGADMTVSDLVRLTRDGVLDALEHESYPFPLVVEGVARGRDPSRSPIFQVLFVYERPQRLAEQGAAAFAVGEPGVRVRVGALDFESLPFPAQREGQFDLTLVMGEVRDEIVLSFDYSTDLFEHATIERAAGHLRQLAEGLASPTSAIGDLPLLTADERAHVAALNATSVEVPALTFHALVAQHAARQPDVPAVVFEGEVVSYADLDRRATALAHELRRQGVERGTRVGLCGERSADLIVGVLAIMKAGGAFVPLDPRYPEDRLTYMLADAEVPVLLVDQQASDRFPAFTGGRLRFDGRRMSTEPDVEHGTAVSPNDLAYVIYTSGSTGRPKGVLVEHRGLVNVAFEQRRMFGVGPGWRVLQFSSMSFDASVFDIAMALGSGGTLYMARQERILPGPPLLETIASNAISIVTLPPTALAGLPKAPLPDLKVITVAGEACSADLVNTWAPGRRFFNLYGPTEATIWATATQCTPHDSTPSIGRPIANTETYVFDERRQLVPDGVPGELYLGGRGLARGYHRQHELTAKAFVDNPFAGPGSRLYKTGDRVRRLPSGDLEFLGRVDSQVKVRGFRVELGEVETVLAQHPDVDQAVAVVRGEAGAAQIAAYIVPQAGASASAGELRAFVRSRLPDFMVPSFITSLDALPISPAGKVDRGRLPAPRADEPRQVVESPTDAHEVAVAAVWAEVLEVPRVGLDDNFFDSGGTSLLVARLLARLDAVAPGCFSMVDLFSLPTVRAQAARLRGSDATASAGAGQVDALLAGRDRLRALAARRAATPLST